VDAVEGVVEVVGRKVCDAVSAKGELTRARRSSRGLTSRAARCRPGPPPGPDAGSGLAADACQAEVGSVGQCLGEPENAQRAVVREPVTTQRARMRIRDDAAPAAKVRALTRGRAREICRPPALWAYTGIFHLGNC
jgi:hypothetical protein